MATRTATGADKTRRRNKHCRSVLHRWYSWRAPTPYSTET